MSTSTEVKRRPRWIVTYVCAAALALIAAAYLAGILAPSWIGWLFLVVAIVCAADGVRVQVTARRHR